MPVVAVIGGIASATAGVAAFGAAATTMGSIMAGLQIVGGVASALGGLTGNKKLQKIGMVASLGAAAVGGISSLAASAKDAGSASTSIMDGATGVAKTTPTYGDWAGRAGADSAGLTMSGIEGEVGALTNPGLPGAATSTTPWASGVQSPGAGMLASGQTTPAAAPAAAMDPATATRRSDFAPSTSDEMAAAQAPLGQADTGSSIFQNFGSALTKNPELTKIGMGMLSGFGQSYMQQQKLKEEERIRQDERSRINASIQGQRQVY